MPTPLKLVALALCLVAPTLASADEAPKPAAREAFQGLLAPHYGEDAS